MPGITLDDGRTIENADERFVHIRGPNGNLVRTSRRHLDSVARAALERTEAESAEHVEAPVTAPVESAALDPAQSVLDPEQAVTLQGQGPVLNLGQPAPAAQDPRIGQPVFNAQGQVLADLPPEQPVAPETGAAARAGLLLESPEDFQRSQGAVRAPQGPQRPTQRSQDAFNFAPQQPVPQQPVPQQPQFSTSTQTTVTRDSTRFTPQQQAEIDRSRAAQDFLVNRSQESFQREAAGIAAEEAKRDKLIAEREAQDAQFQRNLQASEQASEAKLAEIDAATEALRADISDDEIETGRFWRNKSTGQKIGLIIGSMLQALGGNRNPTADIEAAIQRDIEAQESGFKNKDKALLASERMYARARRQGLDKRDALVVSHNVLSAATESRIRNIADRVSSLRTREQLLRTADQLSLNREQRAEQLALSQGTKERRTTTTKRVPIAPTGGVAAGQGSDPLGIPGLHSTGERRAPLGNAERKKLTEQASASEAFRTAVQTMIELRQEFGTERWNSAAKGRYQAARKSVIDALQKSAGGGVQTDRDLERLSGIVPEFSDFSIRQVLPGGGDPTLDKLRGLQAEFTRTTNARLRAFGAELDGTSRRPQRAQRGFAR